MSVTKAAQFNLRPPSTAGRSYNYAVRPQDGNSTIELSRTKVLEFHIPCTANTFLDQSQTYLSFDMQVKPTAGQTGIVVKAGKNGLIGGKKGIFLDGSAYSCFRKLEIYHGANLLETVDNYALLTDIMMDATVGDDQRGHAMSQTYLTLREALASDTNVQGLSFGAKRGAYLVTGEDRSGSGADSTTPFQAPTLTACIPIALSALLSPASKKYLPLYAMQADSLRLQLTLNDQEDAMCIPDPTVFGNVGKLTLSNLALNCQFVELTSDVCGAVLADALANGGGAIRISSESFRSYETSVAAADTSFNIQVPARFSSLNAMLVAFRESANVGESTRVSIGNRFFPGLGQYQFRIGSTLIPSAPVKTPSQALIEFLKCYNGVSAVNFETVIDDVNWLNTAHDASNYTAGTYCLGLECSLFAHANDVVDSGKQTISEVVMLDYVKTNTSTGLTVNTFARFDTAIIISDGLATTVF